MLTYTTTLNKRDLTSCISPKKRPRTSLQLGSGSIFSPERREYRPSAPYEILHALEKGTLTVMQ